MPPASSESTKISGQFPLTAPDLGRKSPARRTVSGEIRRADNASRVESSVEELEPSDSERVTEVPPTQASFSDSGLETIPAPPWLDDPD